MRPEDRERIQIEVVSRVVDRYVERSRAAPEGFLETLVNDTLYHERRRLDRDSSRRAKTDSAFYDDIQRRIQHASAADRRTMLEQMAQRFVAEVVGNFDDRVYSLSTKLLPAGLGLLLNALSPERLMQGDYSKGRLADSIVVQGEADHVRELTDKGTLVVVPTHSSNLDSIVLGFAVYLMGLPPLTYGAGLNLFTNPMLSFFMRNLGAYRVDRKKKSMLYKDVLKEYATCSMEMGYNNLFFPGGTRSRSGAIEQKLKKGLLGTALRSYVGNLKAGNRKPNLYVIPVSLSYKLVLEAETLIADHLKEVGKSRYIIVDDEFSKPQRILTFFKHLMSLDAKVVFDFAPPLDLFGNRVDRDGVSHDPHGRAIDTTRYVFADGEPAYDDQRDHEYTNDLSRQIAADFLRSNVIMSTHLVAFSIFNLLQRNNPELDLYRLLRTGGKSPSFTMTDVHLETERVLELLREMAGQQELKLGDELKGGDVQEIVSDGLKHFAIYHTHPAALRKGDRVFHEDRNLLLYYSNRLRGYDLGRKLGARAEA